MAECIQGHTPDNLHILRSTNQVRGCQTIVRNAQTSRDDFIFYSERLMRMTFEYALSFLPHCDSEVIMPSGQSYQGNQGLFSFYFEFYFEFDYQKRGHKRFFQVKSLLEVVFVVFQF